MIVDYILKFPSKSVAEQFGIASGYAVDNGGVVETTLATHTYALHEIGEHNGSDFWVLFRDLVGIPIPEGGEQFIFWSSASGLDRPTDGMTAPSVFWA
jgi:hypothetical protein